MINKLFVFTDGGSRGNPGPAAIAFVIKDETGKTICRKGNLIGRTTNNVAEYTAVIKALEWLKSDYLAVQSSDYLFTFFLDSQLVVNQLNGLYKIKNAALRDLIIKVRQLEKEIGNKVFYHHISREKNKEADSLINQIFTTIKKAQ